jgi:metaxin
MYLTPNFELLTVPAYITAQSTSNLIRTVTARELRNSAETALLQYKPIISEHTIYLEAEEAFRALATYLKEQMEAKKAPTTLLDAAVFSYVYLLLELQGGVWADRRLADIVRKFPALKTHRDTIRKNHYRARPPGLWKELNAKAVGG